MTTFFSTNVIIDKETKNTVLVQDILANENIIAEVFEKPLLKELNSSKGSETIDG